ncbi:MAG: hypothetical protein NZ911_07260, partial [Sulfolobales archaeon]|nr:hypothetical protein [Sulfolobales archaeon]
MGWDKGVDYTTLYNLIMKHKENSKELREKCYDSILLIQLRNGSRISEAVRAYVEFLKSRKHEVEITVSKKKRR